MASSEIQQCISLSGKLSRRMDLIFLVFGFFFFTARSLYFNYSNLSMNILLSMGITTKDYFYW